MTGGERRRGAELTANRMDRFIDGIELAAAAFIGIVAVDIFVSVLLRYLFSTSIPDSYDFGRLLLGIEGSARQRLVDNSCDAVRARRHRR